MAKKAFERIIRPATAEERQRHAEIRKKVMEEFPPADPDGLKKAREETRCDRMSAVAIPTQDADVVAEEQRFLLRGLDWQTYRAIADALRGRHIRLTYDRGNLEFMTISHRHGNCSGLLARFIGVLTEELGLPIRTCRDMTCDREDLERGLEPDEGFYIDKEPLIREKEAIDLAVDPPPDLAVEVDLSRSPRSRLNIYAAIGVPEVWRFDGVLLLIHQLDAAGKYGVVEHSPRFPFVTGPDLVRFVQQRLQMDENRLVQSFREWVREQYAKQS